MSLQGYQLAYGGDVYSGIDEGQALVCVPLW
jgi:hypothetical protein